MGVSIIDLSASESQYESHGSDEEYDPSFDITLRYKYLLFFTLSFLLTYKYIKYDILLTYICIFLSDQTMMILNLSRFAGHFFLLPVFNAIDRYMHTGKR